MCWMTTNFKAKTYFIDKIKQYNKGKLNIIETID